MLTNQDGEQVKLDKEDYTKEEILEYMQQQQNEVLYNHVYGVACALLSNNIIFDDVRRTALAKYKKDNEDKPNQLQEMSIVGYEIALRALAVNDGLAEGIRGAIQMLRRKQEEASSKIVVPEKKIIVPS